MSMRDSTRKEIKEQTEATDEKGNTYTIQQTIIQRTYACRPQVIERRQKWQKFGDKAKNFPRGKNQKGILNVTGPVPFITDEGEEINE